MLEGEANVEIGAAFLAGEGRGRTKLIGWRVSSLYCALRDIMDERDSANRGASIHSFGDSEVR